MGGSDPAAAYRRFVQQGVELPPESPFQQAAHGFVGQSGLCRQNPS